MRFVFLGAFLEIRGDTGEDAPLDVLNKMEFYFKDFTFGNFGLGQIAVMKPMVSHVKVSNSGWGEAALTSSSFQEFCKNVFFDFCVVPAAPKDSETEAREKQNGSTRKRTLNLAVKTGWP